MKNNIDLAVERALKRFKPPEKISKAEWAEANLYLPSVVSAFPGMLNLDITPHVRHILNAVDDPRFNKYTWISSVQTGKTLMELIVAAYYMSEDPSNILLYEPNDTLARSIAVERFNPIIEANPFLKKLFEEPNTKNNDIEKIFTGGYLNFCNAGSLNDVKSRSGRIVLIDEGDSLLIDLKDAGSTIQLIRDRTIQQPRSKFFLVGSPGGDNSELFAAYEKSNKSVVEYACIYCGEYQDLKFANLKFNHEAYGKSPEEFDAGYECKYCKCKMYDKDKPKFFKHSRIRNNTDKPLEKNHFGLWTNGLYSMSPDLTWLEIANEHMSAKRNKGYAERKRFTNSVLAEIFTTNHKIKESELKKHAIHYYQQLPKDVLLLTAGIDIQHDFIAITVLGWGLEDKIYVIDHKNFIGSTKIDPYCLNTVWSQLDNYLKTSFKHEISGKELYIKTAFLDVADGTNPNGKKYIRKKEQEFQDVPWFKKQTIYASRGHESKFTDAYKTAGYLMPTSLDKITKQELTPIHSNKVKHEVFDRLAIDQVNTYRYVTFPDHLPDEYYNGLLSEIWKEEKKAGNTRGYFKQVVDRNEPLDCFCYGFCAFQKEYGYNKSLLEEMSIYLNQVIKEPKPEIKPDVKPVEEKPKFNFFDAMKQSKRF